MNFENLLPPGLTGGDDDEQAALITKGAFFSELKTIFNQYNHLAIVFLELMGEKNQDELWERAITFSEIEKTEKAQQSMAEDSYFALKNKVVALVAISRNQSIGKELKSKITDLFFPKI